MISLRLDEVSEEMVRKTLKTKSPRSKKRGHFSFVN